jgi:hypothetical protein
MPSIFAPWSNFYVITGSSAAALTGLMFVVVTLIDREPRPGWRDGLRTFSTPTVVHLGTGFLVSAIASAPWPSVFIVSGVLGLVALAGMFYGAGVCSRMLKLRSSSEYRPDAEDWIWFAVLPFVSYVSIGLTAILLLFVSGKALFALAAAVLLFIFIGIHNAWDIVTFIAIVQRAPDDSKEEQR